MSLLVVFPLVIAEKGNEGVSGMTMYLTQPCPKVGTWGLGDASLGWLLQELNVPVGAVWVPSGSQLAISTKPHSNSSSSIPLVPACLGCLLTHQQFWA